MTRAETSGTSTTRIKKHGVVEVAKMSENSKDPKETKGEGLYKCPVCQSKYENSEWRQQDPDRRTCSRGHKKWKMQWFPSVIDALGDRLPQNQHMKRNYKNLGGKGDREK